MGLAVTLSRGERGEYWSRPAEPVDCALCVCVRVCVCVCMCMCVGKVDEDVWVHVTSYTLPAELANEV